MLPNQDRPILLLKGKLTIGSNLYQGKLSSGSLTIKGNINIGSGDRLPAYSGSYRVIPKLDSQLLPTKNKSLLDDVEVTEIPYSEVSNPSGGFTVNIASM